MAAILGSAYADVFDAVGVHSGLAAGSAQDIPSAFAAMKGKASSGGFAVDPKSGHARTMIVHGEKDRTVAAANGASMFEALVRAYPEAVLKADTASERGLARVCLELPDGSIVGENWVVPALAHAWSGGDGAGSFTAPGMPDASEGFVRFFLDGKA